MIIIAYGANLNSHIGDPIQTFHACLNVMRDHNIIIDEISSLWDTAPVGCLSDQGNYTNAVFTISTQMKPDDLMTTLLAIEKEFGRQRSVPNAPRPIDLDLVAYYDQISNTDHLTLPHPRMHQRAFVLMPLQEIIPNWLHPVTGKTLNELIEVLPKDQSFRKIEE